MSVNNMTVEQANVFIQALYKQATGEDSIAVVDSGSFTSVAQAVLKTGMNNTVKSLAQVLSGIKIASRPYSAKMRSIWTTAEEFGNHVLKVSYLDNADAETNKAYTLENNGQFGVHTIKLPKAVEFSIYGTSTISANITIVKKQLRTAFQSASQLASFINGLMTEIRNQMEQQKEEVARGTLINFIAGKYALAQKYSADATQHVIHLLTEYNDHFGKDYATIADCRAVAVDYAQFIKYVYSRIENLGEFFAERSVLYHINPTAMENGGNIKRHTSADKTRLIVNSQFLNEVDSQVMTDIYHTDYLKSLASAERTVMWQSLETPYGISAKPTYTLKDGTLETASNTIAISNVFGVMFDVDALGVGITDDYHDSTPWDAERQCYGEYFAQEWKNWNDFTENGVVLLFD